MKKLNWNSKIKVKLTDYGKDVYYHRYGKDIKNGVKLERWYPSVDEHGYSTFLLWDFMRIYGPHIKLGMKNVVEDISFYIAEKDLDEIVE